MGHAQRTNPTAQAHRALPDLERVAAQVHEAWMATKTAKGVTSRCAENGEELMVPFDDLSEPAKELDRATVRAVYAAIRLLDHPDEQVAEETVF